MTRVAGANPRIWVDIFLDNREALAGVLREHQRSLGEVLAALEAGDAGYLARWIGQSSGHRRRALEAQFDQRPEELYRVQVHVPDRPGVFAGITQALGRRAHQHRGLRAAPLHSRARRHDRAARRGPRGRRARSRAARRPGLRRAGGAGAGGRDVSAATGSDRLEVAPAAALVGELAVPGDKSISHRALLLGAVGDGATEVSGFGPNADTLATLAAVESLGARVERLDEAGTRLRVHGCGLRGLRAPEGAIDVHNAGTLMRLLPGLLVGQSGSFTLDGDESIRRRPVDRVAMPLRLMGAVLGDSDGRPPLHIDGGGELQPIGYELPVASAQVKSCILLAGLYAVTGPTTVIEPVPTRDHTERLLRAAGARVAKGPRTVSVWPVERLQLGGRRRARRHLLGRAVPGRRHAAGRVAAVRPRDVDQPDAHRPADRARAHGRAHQPLQPPHDRRAASRSPTSRCIRPSSWRPRSRPRSCRA